MHLELKREFSQVKQNGHKAPICKEPTFCSSSVPKLLVEPFNQVLFGLFCIMISDHVLVLVCFV